MMRGLACLLFVVLVTLTGCSKSDPAAPLSPDQDRQLQQQLDQARQAEGAAQQKAP